jgi:hypothetical protein
MKETINNEAERVYMRFVSQGRDGIDLDEPFFGEGGLGNLTVKHTGEVVTYTITYSDDQVIVYEGEYIEPTGI